MVIDRVARQPVTALKPIPRSQFSNEPDIATRSRAVDATALSAGCFRRGPRCCELFGYINWIDKKRPGVYSGKIEQKINHFTLFENSIFVFWKLWKVLNLRKNLKNAGFLKLLDIRKTFHWSALSMSLSPCFFCASDPLPKKYRALLLVCCIVLIEEGRREAIKHCARHPALYDGITRALVLVTNSDGFRINMAKMNNVHPEDRNLLHYANRRSSNYYFT